MTSMSFISKLQRTETCACRFLSELPDEVLTHILSFCGTKCVVRTSILSKRWRNVWGTVPNLDFDDEYKFDDFGFKTFVNHVLSVNNSTDITKFRLCCAVEDFSDIDGWICNAVARNVVEVDLSIISVAEQLFQLEMFELPISLLASNKLKALTLRTNFIVGPPFPIRFPSLKFLYVRFIYPDMDSMMNLLSWFPVLEDMTVEATLENEILPLDIVARKLQTLTISLRTEADSEDEDTEDEGDEVADIEGENENHASIGGCSFHIEAPKLETLHFRVDVFSDWKLKNGKSLVRADIDLYDHFASEHPGFANRASALLKSVSDVKYLSLSAHRLKAVCLPSFNNLKEFKLVVQDCNRLESLLLEILERSPNLECLVLDREVDSCDCTAAKKCSESPLEALQSVPLCLTTNLKTISIMRFRGYPEEMEVVKFLLTNSQVLKKMTISMLNSSCGDAEELHRNICMFPRVSKTCKVEFL